MVIAAQAFTEKAVSELKPGSLFLFRQQWAFMGERQSKDPEGSDKERVFVLLQGERAGAVLKAQDSASTCFTFAEPFGWFAAVDIGVPPLLEGELAGSLVISPEGPVLVATQKDRWDDTEHLAFSLVSGQHVKLGVDRARRFLKWSIELCQAGRPYQSLGRILDVRIS